MNEFVISTRICSDCGEEKELSEFYSQNKTKSDGTPYIYYHLECKECTKKRTNKWREDNPEQAFLIEKRRRERMPERFKEVRRNFYVNNTQHEKEYYKNWINNNRDKLPKYNEAHRKHDITDEEWENCKNYFNYRCAYCGLPVEEHYRVWYGEMKQFDLHKEHVDHQGENDLSNCVPACGSCNSSKRTFLLNDWYNESNPNYNMERLTKINQWLSNDYKLYKE